MYRVKYGEKLKRWLRVVPLRLTMESDDDHVSVTVSSLNICVMDTDIPALGNV